MLESLPRTLEWADGALRLVDQRLLPHELAFLECCCSDEVCAAIAELAVRGAPAIGDAGAFAVALWLLNEAPRELTRAQLDERLAVAHAGCFLFTHAQPSSSLSAVSACAALGALPCQPA